MNISEKNKLSVYPVIDEFDYTEKLSSTKINKMLTSIEESSLRAILRGAELQSKMDHLNIGTIKSYQAMQSRTEMINHKTLSPVGYNGLFATATAFDTVYDNQILSVDKTYGYVTLKQVSSYSKIPRGDNYNGRVSPNVSIYLKEGAGSYELFSQDSDIYDSLDGQQDSFWIREVTADTEYTIKIELPPSVTKRFNYIELFPFPVYGFDILSVEYNDIYGNVIDVTKYIYGKNNVINNHGEPIKLYLSPKEFNGTIYIKCKSTNLGVIGFSNIDVKFIDFDNTTARGLMQFDTLSSYTSTVTNTYDITLGRLYVDFYIDSPQASSLVTNVYSDIFKLYLMTGKITDAPDSLTTISEIKLSDKYTFDINKTINIDEDDSLFLVFDIAESNLTTPVIRGAKLQFEVEKV